MKIHGLMKMTLLDYPGLVACTVFLGGCDMRCPYCHNWELLDMNAPAIMDDEELLAFLNTRKGLLDAVVFTGGEALLRNDLAEVIRKVRKLGFKIKLDTNGNHPDKLKNIVEEGLIDYVAMDVKNSPDRYGMTIGLPEFSTVRIGESIEYLLHGPVEYEFRTTVVKQFHDEESFRQIGEWIRGAKRYYLQGFVDRDTVPYEGLSACSREQMETFLTIVAPCVQTAEIRGV
ncbi:MAG: anaerobic ribonucleoside-triphosphate reductase activating protein [Lachnospiraceae bacterium]|nr:anaerobic ribonucleoside-triphosphate reductase activating protein [Lachnospiraceae bacterium]